MTGPELADYAGALARDLETTDDVAEAVEELRTAAKGWERKQAYALAARGGGTRLPAAAQLLELTTLRSRVTADDTRWWTRIFDGKVVMATWGAVIAVRVAAAVVDHGWVGLIGVPFVVLVPALLVADLRRMAGSDEVDAMLGSGQPLAAGEVDYAAGAVARRAVELARADTPTDEAAAELEDLVVAGGGPIARYRSGDVFGRAWARLRGNSFLPGFTAAATAVAAARRRAGGTHMSGPSS